VILKKKSNQENSRLKAWSRVRKLPSPGLEKGFGSKNKIKISKEILSSGPGVR